MRLDLRKKLTQLSWEEALLSWRPYTANGWNEELGQTGLIVDLSRVEWPEPDAAIRVVLFIERALLDGINVTVRMPRTTPTRREVYRQSQAESNADTLVRIIAAQLRAAVQRRVSAEAMLNSMEFPEALRHPHLAEAPGKVAFVFDHDWSRSEAGVERPEIDNDDDGAGPTVSETPDRAEWGGPEPPGKRNPWFFDRIYPLRWVAHPRTESTRQELKRLSEADVLARLLRHGSGRVSYADGRTLAEVFMKELAENAVDHGQQEYALVGAWNRPAKIGPLAAEVPSCVRDFTAWSRKYPLIEITVGDSGLGIPHTLGAAWRDAGQPNPFTDQAAREEDRILAWALNKWSTRENRAEKRGTRGLYRVERIVRKHGGLISLRSQWSFVAVSCMDTNDAAPVREGQGRYPSLARSPGTVANVRIPVLLADYAPAGQSPLPLRKTTFTLADLGDLPWSSSPAAAIRIACDRAEALCRNAPGDRPAAAILDMAGARLEHREDLEDLLVRLTDLAHPVALILSNLGGPAWNVCRGVIESIATSVGSGAALPSAEHESALHIKDPILVHHSHGNQAWVGVPESLADLFGTLLSEGYLSAERVAQMEPDSERRHALLRLLSEEYHVVYRTPRGIHMRFNHGDIDLHLADSAQRVIGEQFKEWASQTEQSGIVFLTPTLRYVTSFVPVSKRLEDSDLVERAASGLASRCARALAGECRGRQVEIVADFKISWNLLDRLRYYLMDRLQPLGVAGVRISQVAPGDLPTLALGSLVVIFADIIFTEATLGRLLSQVVRARGNIAAVATIFDARLDSNKFVQYMAKEIETIHLCPVSVKSSGSAPAGLSVVDINPETLSPEVPAAASPQYPISSDQLTDWVLQEKAIYFDHIVRPNGRHFCSYLDPLALLVGHEHVRRPSPAHLTPAGKALIGAFNQAITELLKNAGNATADIIFYPQNEQPSAAEVVARSLKGEFGCETLPITEGGIDKGWLISGSFDDPKPAYSTAVIVDWGSLSGRHVRNLIRQVAAAQVKHIIVVIFLSEMGTDEEEFLRQLQSIQQDEGAFRASVQTTFLARLPIASYDRANCPHCKQLDRLKDEERSYPSDLLREYVEEERKRLREISVFDAAQQKVTPSSGEELRQLWPDAIMAMTLLRDMLDRARHRTDGRKTLLKELQVMELGATEADRQKRLHLVTLLAAEWPWLKQDPMVMSLFKDRVAALSAAVVRDNTCAEADRKDAIVVLRTASKKAFANHLPDLFMATVHSGRLVRQLLYCAFTYLHRDYQLKTSLDPLVKGLQKCMEHLKVLLAGEVARSVEPVAETVIALYQYGTYLLSREDLTALEAWRILSDLLGPSYDRHNPAVRAFDATRVGVTADNDATMRRDYDWAKVWEDWRTVGESFLVDLIRLMGPLQAIFQGADAALKIGRERQSELVLFKESAAMRHVSVLTAKLNRFARDPDTTGDSDEWRAFMKTRDWMWDLLLDPGTVEPTGRVGGSALVRLAKGCPVNAQEIALQVASEWQNLLSVRVKQDGLDADDAKVFVHGNVLHSCLEELLRNAHKHTTPSTSGHPVHVEINLSVDGDRVVIRVLNDGLAHPKPSGQNGVPTIRQSLIPYGGDLPPIDRPAGTWTHEARLILRKWVAQP